MNYSSCKQRKYFLRALQEEGIGILSPEDTVSLRNQPVIQPQEKEDTTVEDVETVVNGGVEEVTVLEELPKSPPKRIERKKQVDKEDSDDRFTVRNGIEVTNFHFFNLNSNFFLGKVTIFIH